MRAIRETRMCTHTHTNTHTPDDLYLGGTLCLFLLPLKVVPVEVKEEDNQGGYLVALLVQPVGLQDARGLTLLVVSL